MIKLKDMNAENFYPVINLKLSDEDRGMVAPNVYSLAEAYCNKNCVAKAIYKDDEVIGFIMFAFEKEEVHIARLMIATEHQGKGYGSKALKLVMDDLRENIGVNQFEISYRPSNDKARYCYKKLGFIETGEIDDGETVARCRLS